MFPLLAAIRFGQVLFFEQPITNPFSHEERFEIDLGKQPVVRLSCAVRIRT